ncbi:MAG: hypothetical protein PHD13_04620 [Methanocellales archaeon]|nr:hypothetical protein [Methanocellales archaeon]MDD3291264.1 hypothetical protein [Methanocellales archaeon]MDD5235436.1 hypothetical protein [Methanocellales archaeon]MDD5484481.1 hypothetical protein [Methanocellales archaeon]
MNAEPRIQVVAHCLLNPTVKIGKKIEFISNTPVIQLPCPETIYFGLNRWETTKNQLDFPKYRRFCRRLFRPYADLIQQLAEKGIHIEIIGVAKSPSCATELTTRGYLGGKIKRCEHEHVVGKGVFFEEIESELSQRGIPIKMSDHKHRNHK